MEEADYREEGVWLWMKLAASGPEGLVLCAGTDLVWKLKEVAEHLIGSAFRKFTRNTVKN